MWLGRQHLDLYLPGIALAIEYMGEQHYRAVEIFGGQKRLERQQALDRRKRRLCAENGVTLIEIGYSQTIDQAWVDALLERCAASRACPDRGSAR
jgi:hypothetical protein